MKHAIRRVVTGRDSAGKAVALGSEPVGGSAEELATIMKVQSRKWKAVNRTAHIRAE